MKLTPGMQQYMQVKNEYPDAIVLFRMGDFYECFFEDAKTVSRILGITLTARGKDETRAPLAGIPYHALDKYLKTLVEQGQKIAICEQIEDPKFAKGIVKRAVTRIITPGTVVEDSILTDKANNYIASLFVDQKCWGLAWCDISTGEFLACEFETAEQLATELSRLTPSECIVPSGFSHTGVEQFLAGAKVYVNKVQEYFFWYDKAAQTLKTHFAADNVSQIGLANQELAVCAAGGLLTYLQNTQKINLSYINTIKKYNTKDYLVLDTITIKNLELIKTISDNKKQSTLLTCLDRTNTSMGARLLRNWILHPLVDSQKITARLAAVENIMHQTIVLDETSELLKQIADMERIISRINYGLANARDLVTIKQSLQILGAVKSTLENSQTVSSLIRESSTFADVSQIINTIDRSLKDECPLSVREGNFIKRGYHKELDELWSIRDNAREYLAKLEQDEIQKTNISSLKIRYNRVFGYYIEVTNRFKNSIPAHYIRKQSTVNGERFITEELKDLEVKILGAQDRINEIEFTLFQEICEHVKKYAAKIQENARKIAVIDCICSFAKVSLEQNYISPTVNDGFEIHVTESRHPVIERTEKMFVPNDCSFTPDQKMMIITGPNMAGKSTFMRQIALITIMAQIGCFVPCKKATIGIVDRIFTRVGAYDDIARGQSTFMVEMSETANILTNATERSLIILDEIGSGTSTYDGVAIAWAVACDIAKRIKAKTLFSTHYHVLTKLDEIQGVVNYNIAVLEKDDTITFLRKIIKGGTDKSYGIYAAKLAGVPNHVLEHARKIQLQLEQEDSMHTKIVIEKRHIETKEQTSEEIVAYAKLKQKTLFDIQK